MTSICLFCTIAYPWLCVQLVNNTQFSELVNGEDETALQYLNNLTVEEYEDPNSGYKISFVSVYLAILL